MQVYNDILLGPIKYFITISPMCSEIAINFTYKGCPKGSLCHNVENKIYK